MKRYVKQREHRIQCALHCKKGIAILILSGFICGCNTSGHAYKADIEKRTVDIDKKTVDIDKKTVDVDKRTVDIDKETIDIDKSTVDVDERIVPLDENTVEIIDE